MERELSNKSLAGDAMGQFSLNVATGLLGIITYYYTDIVGVSAGLVGTIMLFTKAVDALADVGMGVLVDRTKTKHGQARPWLLWMVIPMFLSILLLFSVPDVDPTVKIAYAVLTNFLFFVCVLTPTAIPYASLMALTSKSPRDRSLMGIYRSGFGYLAGMVVAIGFVPIVNAMGGGRQDWTLLAAIFGAVAAGGIYVAFRSTKEKYNTDQLRESGEVKQGFSLWNGLKLLVTNKYWVIIASTGLLSNIIFAMSGTSGMYYAKYIWGDVNLISIMGAIGLLPVLVVFLLSGTAIKRMGKRNTAIVGLAIGVLGGAVRLIDPYSISLGLAGSMLQAFGMIPLMIVLAPLVTDTIEYGEWKHGHRIVGLTNSVNGFGGKMGTAFGTALVGWLLAFGQYREGVAEQAESAKNMIIVFNIHIPMLLYICIAILLFFFSLEKQYTRILDDLEARRVL
jgi:glycoside/pentoside/hexuronide:cation symporter, GPH family